MERPTHIYLRSYNSTIEKNDNKLTSQVGWIFSISHIKHNILQLVFVNYNID